MPTSTSCCSVEVQHRRPGIAKATPLGAVAKFTAGGKRIPKKDIAMMAMNYGRAYVAHIAMGGNNRQA